MQFLTKGFLLSFLQIQFELGQCKKALSKDSLGNMEKSCPLDDK